jgi:hypothetical protein
VISTNARLLRSDIAWIACASPSRSQPASPVSSIGPDPVAAWIITQSGDRIASEPMI